MEDIKNKPDSKEEGYPKIIEISKNKIPFITDPKNPIYDMPLKKAFPDYSPELRGGMVFFKIRNY